MSIEEDCMFKEINLKKQKINLSNIQELLYNTYNNIIFSTLPYILYKENISKRCINYYNSGNCIGICEFIKLYLKQNFNVNSVIIPASVPQQFKTKGTPHLTHCAILIPISYHEFYIIDCALYFLKPMYCDLNNNIYRRIELSNIYSYEIESIDYIVENCTNLLLDNKYNQKIIDKTICVKCNFTDDPLDHWKYYLNEIINPDYNIGYSYILNKPKPFLLYTKIIDNKPVLIYKLVIDTDGTIIVKQYPENKIILKGDSILFNDSKIARYIDKFLSSDFI
tara:strand:- start:38269 stop:39108 length:840 start_codon:yes stop_codon:yes gene_type:complete